MGEDLNKEIETKIYRYFFIFYYLLLTLHAQLMWIIAYRFKKTKQWKVEALMATGVSMASVCNWVAGTSLNSKSEHWPNTQWGGFLYSNA